MLRDERVREIIGGMELWTDGVADLLKERVDGMRDCTLGLCAMISKP
jgi:hypothetical protein